MALVKCRQCGTNMLSDAATCPGCGAPVARGMSRKKLLLIVFGGLGMCLVGTCLLGVVLRGAASSNRASSPSAAESARWVDIRKLLAEYADNEVRADATFKGRYVLIDGIVGDVKRDVLNTIYITIGTGRMLEIPQVQCFFSEAHATQAAKFSKGSKITVRGRVDGLMGNVLLRDCEFP
jgi:hypothetical protein